MMGFSDPSMAFLAASGGDTVKLFDLSAQSDRDLCALSYSPSPGSHVNSVKWNHTNLVVASAGDDRKISLWRKNGQTLGTVPVSGIDSGDNIDESISTISFSNKGSRYICSGGTGQVVRIWDLQRKRCIKKLKGHIDTITGVMYNCKDEHLASISLRGDLILHNLASATKTAELKDPNGQVLRVLDYSRISRHLLATAGDDGSIHLWDTTGRSPKVSWLKQHSAPITGLSFSPSIDKIIACVGLDKKLYTLDTGTKKHAFCIPYEAPFSSLAFRDDGWILAMGTNNGRVVFYDMRGKPQPITSLHAYSNSEAVTSLCWQRSKPVIVSESSTAEVALLGGAGEDSILMPDPLPSVTSSSLSLSTAVSGSRRLGLSFDSSSLATTSSGSMSSKLYSSTAEETPHRNHLWTGASLSRLHPPHTTNFKDDMEVFSPLVDVQPITPSLDKLWDDHGDTKKDNPFLDRKPSSLLFPSSTRRFPFSEEGSGNSHPIFDWKANSTSTQDDARSPLSGLGGATPTTSSKSDDSYPLTPPEAWGGEGLLDKFDHLRPSINFPSRFGMLTSGVSSSGSMAGLHSSSFSTGQMSMSSLTNAGLNYTNLRTKDISSNVENSLGLADHPRFSSIPTSLGTKGTTGQASLDSPGSASLNLPRRFSTYAERISTTASFSEGTALATGSPKSKKTGAETREELLNNSLLRSDTSAAAGMGMFPTINGGTSQPLRGSAQMDMQQGSSSFTLQLVQRTLEETLASVQKSMHDDMRNLHIELLRQFHIQEMEMSSLINAVLENQAELLKEVQSLRKENQQLRQLL